jgi:hypothetical protein
MFHREEIDSIRMIRTESRHPPEGFSWPQTTVRSPTCPWMALLGPMRFSPPAHLTSRDTISRFQDKIEMPMFQVISGALRTDMEMVRQIK